MQLHSKYPSHDAAGALYSSPHFSCHFISYIPPLESKVYLLPTLPSHDAVPCSSPPFPLSLCSCQPPPGGTIQLSALGALAVPPPCLFLWHIQHWTQRQRLTSLPRSEYSQKNLHKNNGTKRVWLMMIKCKKGLQHRIFIIYQEINY